MRKRVALGCGLAAVVVALATAGCQQGAEEVDPGCLSGASSAGAPGEAPIMFAFGAAVDRLTGGVGAGTVLVYADGAVVRTMDPTTLGGGGGRAVVPRLAPGFFGDQPGYYEVGHLSDCALGVVVSSVEAIVDDGSGFGMPVTDATGTTFSYRADGAGAIETDGIDMFDPDDPDEWSDSITPAQQRNRDRAATLWFLLEDAVVVTGELEIERLQLELHYGATVEDSEVTWSLPPLHEVLGGQQCVELAGDDVAPVIDALAESGGTLLPEEDWRLSARTLPPGMPACETA